MLPSRCPASIIPAVTHDPSPGTPPPSRGAAVWLRALRPQQWFKNALVLLPLGLSHQVADVTKLSAGLLAVVVFCFASSAAYVLNDILDRHADREHPAKRRRPFASGALPAGVGWVLIPALLAAAFAPAGLLLPVRFVGYLLAYWVATNLYSLWLKSRMLVDVLVLAGLYTLRIRAGGEAVDVVVSPWLMGMSVFLFSSLALVKRYTELLETRDVDDDTPLRGRGYRVDDADVLLAFGAACGAVSVLVLALYIHSEDVRKLYANPEALWLACPLLLYWIARVWMLARRRRLDADPVVFALTDRVSWIAAVGVVSAMVLAKRPFW